MSSGRDDSMNFERILLSDKSPMRSSNWYSPRLLGCSRVPGSSEVAAIRFDRGYCFPLVVVLSKVAA
jgi:hypothetical protein